MSLIALWTGMLGGPIVWLAYLEAAYALTPSACVAGNKHVLALVTLAAFVATAAIVFLSWRAWRASGAETATEHGDIIGRSRFMALSGLGLSTLSALLVIASAIPIAVLGACD